MPATDSVAPLLEGATLTESGVGPVVEINEPGHVLLTLTIGDCSGSSEGSSASIEVQSSDDPNFGTYFAHGKFMNLAPPQCSGETLSLVAYITGRYARAVTTITGTSPSFPVSVSARTEAMLGHDDQFRSIVNPPQAGQGPGGAEPTPEDPPTPDPDPPPPIPQATWRTQGADILRPNGSVWQGRGVNCGGASGFMEFWHGDGQAQWLIDTWNINSVRLVWCQVCANHTQWGGRVGSYVTLQQFCDEYTALGMVVIIERHEGIIGLQSRTEQEINDCVSDMQSMASQFANNPLVWLSPWNEPIEEGNTTNRQAWLDCHTPVIAAIRAISPSKIIVINSSHYGQDQWETTGGYNAAHSAILQEIPNYISTYGNIVADVHFYSRHAAGGAAGAVSYFNAIRAAGIPVIVGETGGISNGAQQYQRDDWTATTHLYAATDSINISGIYPWHGYMNPANLNNTEVGSLHWNWCWQVIPPPTTPPPPQDPPDPPDPPAPGQWPVDPSEVGPRTGLTASAKTYYQTANEVVTSKLIDGNVTVKATNVKFVDCKIMGRVNIEYQSGGSVTLEYCEIDGSTRSIDGSILLGGYGPITAKHCYIHHGHNGIRCQSSGMTIEDCIVEVIGKDYFNPAWSDHYTAFGCNGVGSNPNVIRRTRFEVDANGGSACVALYGDFAQIKFFTFEDCYFDGGPYTMHGGSDDAKAYPLAKDITITRCEWGPTNQYGRMTSYDKDAVNHVWYDNWYWSGGVKYSYAQPDTT